MRRPPLLATAVLLALALAAPAAGAPTRTIDLPQRFAKALPKVEAKTVVPVLLPQAMPYDGTGRLYTASAARSRAWRLDLAAAPRCHEATACFVAVFSARRGGSVAGGRKVALRGGRTGHFHPLSCGASCSPPSIAWRQHGAAYVIQARVGGRKTERRILVRMANEAIAHGAR
jgi:hypothetical protein